MGEYISSLGMSLALFTLNLFMYLRRTQKRAAARKQAEEAAKNS
jgi:preprotein translocase subunit YajC